MTERNSKTGIDTWVAKRAFSSKGFAHQGSTYSYWEVEGGGGSFPTRPSPPNGRAAALLLKKRGLDTAAKQAQMLSVKEAVAAMTTLPG